MNQDQLMQQLEDQFLDNLNDEPTAIHWTVVGYDTKKHMNERLGYLTDTAAQAEAKCKQLHPNLEVYYTYRHDQWET